MLHLTFWLLAAGELAPSPNCGKAGGITGVVSSTPTTPPYCIVSDADDRLPHSSPCTPPSPVCSRRTLRTSSSPLETSREPGKTLGAPHRHRHSWPWQTRHDDVLWIPHLRLIPLIFDLFFFYSFCDWFGSMYASLDGWGEFCGVGVRRRSCSMQASRAQCSLIIKGAALTRTRRRLIDHLSRCFLCMTSWRGPVPAGAGDGGDEERPHSGR